jgi:outer membrane lipoprotein carrier protein
MKKILTATFLLASCISYSQQNSVGKSDPAAKQLLDAVSAKFKGYKTVTAKFNLRIENATGKLEGAKSGTVNMKGTKYHITVPNQEIFCDGTNIWTVDKSSNEVQVTKFDNSTNTITPQKLFTNFYDKDFLYKLNGDMKEGGKTVQEVELTPVDKTKPFFKVLVHIDKATKSIVNTRVFEKNGNRYIYSVASMTTNTNLPDASFNFDQKKYPGIEVVDLR